MKSNNYNEIQISWNFLLVSFLAALATIFETFFFFFSACFWALRTSRGTGGSFDEGDLTNGAATRSVEKIQNKVLKIIFKIWRIFPKGFKHFWQYRYQIFYSSVSYPDIMMITIIKIYFCIIPVETKHIHNLSEAWGEASGKVWLFYVGNIISISLFNHSQSKNINTHHRWSIPLFPVEQKL